MEELLKIELSSKSQYSYGFYHSGIDLFHHLCIKNLSSVHYHNLIVSFRSAPNILIKGDCVVDSLLSEGFRFLSCDFVSLDLSYLASLKTLCDVSITVTVCTEQGELLASSDYSVKLLPYFWFSGIGTFPETASFFVTPQQSEIADISDGIRFSDMLDFSQSIYDWIKEKKITFASEDYSGNIALPVRLPERVLREGFGNALELSILFASCLERAGFHPVLAFLGKGKVFVGVRDSERKLKLLTELDRSQKNLEGIHFLDSSYFALGSELSFDQALLHSKNSLLLMDERITLLDLTRARRHNLFPLPNRASEGGTWVLEEVSSCRLHFDFKENDAMLRRFADDKRIRAILSNERIPASGQKANHPFQYNLDVNQNKVLSKILSNDFTLIRAQMGSGASTLLANAASSALRTGKRVLLVTDESYHSEGLEQAISQNMHFDFVLHSKLLEQPYQKETFSGFFDELNDVYKIKEDLSELLAECDRYYASLEGDKRIVSSFLSAADRYHQLKDANDCIVFSPEQVGKLSDEEAQGWFSTVNQLVKSFAEIGNVSENPLALIRNKNFSYEYKSKLILQLESLLACIENIINIREQLDSYFPSLSGRRSISVFLSFLELLRLFGDFPFVPVSFFDEYHRIDENFRKTTHLIQAKKENDSISETILISFDDGIFELDAKDLHDRYVALSSDKSLKGMSQRHAILKTVKRYLRPNCDVENIEYIFSRLHAYQNNQNFISKEIENVFSLFSVPLRDGEYDWNTLQLVSDLCYQCYSEFLEILPPEGLPDFVFDYKEANSSYATTHLLNRLRLSFDEFLKLKDDFESLVSNQLHFFFPKAQARDEDYFAYLYDKLSDLLSKADHLKEWCSWLQLKEKADQIGLKNLIASIESGKIEAGECKRSFLRAFFKAVCEYNFITHPELLPGAFPSEQNKRDFYDRQCKLQEIRVKELNTILSLRRMDGGTDFEEKEILPLDLLRSNQKAFFDVFPCSLFEVGEALEIFGEQKLMFDYVFIESRNKIKLRDFIRLLSFGKKVAFVGMFSESRSRNCKELNLDGSAFDYLWKVTDEKYSLSAVYQSTPNMVALQSAYASCMRSDVRMYTIPSPKFEKCGEWITVRGNFDLEYEGANLAEAEYCVDRLIQFALSEKNKRIGIVTLTQQQKNLILRLLSQKLRHHDDLAELFSDYSRFHVFSVNETLTLCDEIVLSLVFAPNRALPSSGFPIAFYEFAGPEPYKAILEILCSARSSLTVVSSFDPDSRKFSNSILPAGGAVELLYEILNASEVNNSYNCIGAFEASAVIQDLERELKNRGYRVLTGIQNGRYYLDLAVQDNDNNFLLGIISDRTITNQKSNISAIEFSNEKFYESCGWKIFRLRSTDCFDSFEKELECICNIISPEKQFHLI